LLLPWEIRRRETELHGFAYPTLPYPTRCGDYWPGSAV
jgi:hypothetical protein